MAPAASGAAWPGWKRWPPGPSRCATRSPGAVGLEQAIPASLRAAGPSLRDPLARLVDRLHTRLPMPDALRRFADELDDPGADLIIAALIINARLRGPGLRDLLGALSASVREELDMRRKVNAERRSTRRSAQIVVGVSVGLALGLAVFNRSYVHTYDSPLGQLVLAVVVALYAGGFIWMRRLATFDTPQRLLLGPGPAGPDGRDPGPAGSAVMTRAVLAGALAGAGLFLFLLALLPGGPAWPGRWPRSTGRTRRRPPAPRGERDGAGQPAARPGARRVLRRAGLGVPVAARPTCRCRPVVRELPGHQGAAGAVRAAARPAAAGWFGLAGVRIPVVIPVWLGLAVGGVFFFLPDLEVKQQADARRRDFRHAIGAFLDLVVDEPVRRPGRPRGADGGQRDRHRLGACGGSATRWPTPGSPARRRGRRSARWARRSASTNCATWPPRSAWSPTTGPRCASR